MATGGSSRHGVDQRSHELGEDDLKAVFDALVPVAEKYEFFGIQINVKINEIENISRTYSDPNQCLLKILHARLKQIPSLTWNDVDTALRSDCVAEGKLADRIKKRYGHLYSAEGCTVGHIHRQERVEARKGKRAKKDSQQYYNIDSHKVSESKRHRRHSEKHFAFVDETAATKTQTKFKKPHKHSKPHKGHEREIKHEGKTLRKKEVPHQKLQSETSGSEDGVSKVMCQKDTEQRAIKEVETESENESFVSFNQFAEVEDTYPSEKKLRSDEKCYQKHLEQASGDEYASENQTPVANTESTPCSLLSKTEQSRIYQSQIQHERKAKQKKKAITDKCKKASDAHESHETVAQEHNSKSEKHTKQGAPKLPREGESECLAIEDEILGFSYHRKETQAVEQQAQKIMERNVDVAKLHNPDREVRAKFTHKPIKAREMQSARRSEAVNESKQPQKEKFKEYRKNDGKEVKLKRKPKTNRLPQRKWENFSRSSDVDVRGKSKEGNENIMEGMEGLQVKADFQSSTKEKEKLAKKVKGKKAYTQSSDNIEEESTENKESDSDNSSGYEGDRNPEQMSLNKNEEEERELDKDSSSDTSEDEVNGKTNFYMSKMKKMKETQGRNQLNIPGDVDESDSGGSNWEHDYVQKTKRTRRHKKRSMNPTVSGSFSPSTLQEKSQFQPRGKTKTLMHVSENKKKNDDLDTSSFDSDDFSPGCQREKYTSDKPYTKPAMSGQVLASPKTRLDEKDLGHLYEALYLVSPKYKPIGLQIGVSMREITLIEMKWRRDPRECLLEILSTRLKKSQPLTCGDIEKALRSASVCEHNFADGVREKLTGPDDSLCGSDKIQPVTEAKKKLTKEGHFILESIEGQVPHELEFPERGRKQLQKKLSISSELDDSSTESDIINLTKDEMKNLRKVFKRFFGRLCQTITNPVEIATLLQIKGLVSLSVMNDLLISPESNQEKAIKVVEALYKKIKPHPHKIFTMIEVFCDSEADLLKLGTEIWSEIGTICPDRILSSILPPPNQPPIGYAREINPTADVYKLQPPTTIDFPLQVVSQCVKQSGLYPVLMKYKQYLQSCYNARALAPADKYLPTLEAPYINLAMIMKEKYNPDRDEFTRRTLHGGIDQILQRKSPINMKQLLTPEDSGGPIRFVLVEGPPGIGKTTFAWEVCRRWDEIENLSHYHTVVLLMLREKWVLNAASLSDLFRYPSRPDFSISIAEDLMQLQGENLLLILDGFDEISHSFNESSVIKSILCRQLLPKCTIILTTRPVAKATLESICQPRIDKHVEIIGFKEEERVKYVNEVFSKNPELQVNFLRYMFIVPHIKSMMYIPLNCAIIAKIYHESQSSHHLTLPRTRTELYKALTHSLLNRHMKRKESKFECVCMLPEGLKVEEKKMFIALTKFAFDSYHKSETKVTFFREDIPDGFVHFGFMNESTEMYAGKGVERIFSFLHLSLQEYLAAWYVANSYSIEFQVAYHRFAVDPPPLLIEPYKFSFHHFGFAFQEGSVTNKRGNKDEEALISAMRQRRTSLVEPAIFLAGITSWRSQSEDDRNHWEMYLSHDTVWVGNASVFLRSLYEAQNPTLIPHYFNAESYESRLKVFIGSKRVPDYYLPSYFDPDPHTPYECYALSYCLAHLLHQYGFVLTFAFNKRDDVSLVETFVKGLNDHCKSIAPRVKLLDIHSSHPPSLVDSCLQWLMKAKLVFEGCSLSPTVFNSPVAQNLMQQSLFNLQSLMIHDDTSFGTNQIIPIKSWEWLAALKSISKLKVLNIISSSKEYSLLPTNPHCWPAEHRLAEIVLDIKFPSNTIYDVHSTTDIFLGSVLNSVLRSNHIVKMVLPNISRETMACVRSILLHCPSLVTLELKRTRLGYDGILYICRALRNNTTLSHLLIHDDLQLPPSREERKWDDIKFLSFSFMERITLPNRATCTDFLLELNNILKHNATLEEMKIQSGLFLPLSAGKDGEYCQWTGLGPLQNFNVGAVGRGTSPNIRRSFSSSDLTQPQTLAFWDRQYNNHRKCSQNIDFGMFFSKRKKLFCPPSFPAPDTEILQSFSGLDPRLKECLEISHLHQYVERLMNTCWGLFDNVTEYLYGNNN